MQFSVCAGWLVSYVVERQSGQIEPSRKNHTKRHGGVYERKIFPHSPLHRFCLLHLLALSARKSVGGQGSFYLLLLPSQILLNFCLPCSCDLQPFIEEGQPTLKLFPRVEYALLLPVWLLVAGTCGLLGYFGLLLLQRA